MKTYSIIGSVEHINPIKQNFIDNDILFKEHFVRNEWQQIVAELIVNSNRLIATAAANPQLIVSELLDR